MTANTSILLKNMARKVAVATGVGIITLCLLEGALRLAGFYNTVNEKEGGNYIQMYGQTLPDWYLLHIPQDSLIQKTNEFSFISIANNYGFRDADFDTTKPSGRKRILTIGDSFVEGIGAEQNDAWPAQLEQILNRHVPDSFRVYNCGVASSDPFYAFVLLRDKLLQFHPDVVIMSVNYSDVHDFIIRGGIERFKANGSVRYNSAPWFEPLYRQFHVIRFFVHFILCYDYSLLSPTQHAEAYERCITQIEQTLINAQHLCADHQIKFLVVVHPYFNPNDKYLVDQNRLAQINTFLRDKRVPSVSLFEPMEKVVKKSNYETYAWKQDRHYTAKGYKLFAETLFQEVNEDYPGFWN